MGTVSMKICVTASTLNADGNPIPAYCTDGAINVLAWRYIATSYPNILVLGPNATESQALQTMCEGTIVGGEVSLAAQVAATITDGHSGRTQRSRIGTPATARNNRTGAVGSTALRDRRLVLPRLDDRVRHFPDLDLAGHLL